MREQDAWLCFANESGQGMRPPKARTWSPRGTTPVVKVTGRGGGRVSLVSAVCCRLGERTRLVYRILVRHPGRRGEKKGFRESDLAAFLDAAHQELGCRPIVLVWDNSTQHTDRAMRALLAALIRTRLKRMQYRPGLLDGFIAETGLVLTLWQERRTPTRKPQKHHGGNVQVIAAPVFR